jgi:enediyne biosynthesis protein E3
MGPAQVFRLPESRLTGFVPDGSPAKSDLLEVIAAFAEGYNQALTGDPDVRGLPRHLHGFAYEGAAMSCTLLDTVTLSGNRRLRALAENAGGPYIHLVHVGAGWALARLRRARWRGIGDPMLRWLAWDGWGFHQAYFKPRRVFHDHWIERGARGATQPIRDQGTGRALWFYTGADPGRIAGLIGAYPEHRRRDLWAGIGLAAGYTGVCRTPGDLLEAGAGYRAHLAQGAAFAAKAHVLSGHVPPGAARSIELLTGADPQQAADWTDEARARIPRPDSPGDYERWRADIRGSFERHAGGVLP